MISVADNFLLDCFKRADHRQIYCIWRAIQSNSEWLLWFHRHPGFLLLSCSGTGSTWQWVYNV